MIAFRSAKECSCNAFFRSERRPSIRQVNKMASWGSTSCFGSFAQNEGVAQERGVGLAKRHPPRFLFSPSSEDLKTSGLGHFNLRVGAWMVTRRVSEELAVQSLANAPGYQSNVSSSLTVTDHWIHAFAEHALPLKDFHQCSAQSPQLENQATGRSERL